MNPKQPFKWRHFQSSIILLNVRWDLKYPLSWGKAKEATISAKWLKLSHTGNFSIACS